MRTSLYIGTEKLDLFEDDNIIIDSSIANSGDITKIFTDTSNSFSVPATDNNNKIFKHYYNASINDPFDARKLVLGAIYLDGLHYKTGNFKLNKVIVESQKPASYSLDFFGLLTELKELIKDDKLSVLDLSSFDFSYSSANVYNKLSLPFLDVAGCLLTTNRYIYDSNTNTNNTDLIKNLAYNNNSSNNGIDFYDANFSIKNIKIIEAIEIKYGLTFSREFFGDQAFSELYLLLNGGSIVNKLKEDITFDTSDDATLENNNTLLSTNLTFSETDEILIVIETFTLSNPGSVTSIVYSNGIEISKLSGGFSRLAGNAFFHLLRKSDFPKFDNITFEVQFDNVVNFEHKVIRSNSQNTFTSIRNGADVQSVYKVIDKVPDIKIIDYLKGLFQAYKLVAIPTSGTDIFIDTLDNFYTNGISRDITEYIDFKKTPISVGKILNEINYKFQEGTTVLSNQFRTSNGNIDYGNFEKKILDDSGELIEGSSLDYQLPFENMVYEKLQDLNGNDEVNIVYGLMADNSLEPITIKPHLHYLNNINLVNPAKLINSPSSVSSLSYLNTPSHTLGIVSPQFSTVFSEEFNEYNGAKITGTLYSNYHQEYIESIFNEKTRSYQFTIKDAPLDLIKNLKLNDVLLIKGKTYRIEKHSTNLITKEIILNLINTFNVSMSPQIFFTADTEKVYASSDLRIDTLKINKNYTEIP